MNENRFARLMKLDPHNAEILLEQNKKSAMKTFKYYQRLAQIEYGEEN